MSEALATFREDVHEGLSDSPKRLPSKYFYNKKGDDLFRQIMQLPEYYLTRAELEIFCEQAQSIIEALGLKPWRHCEVIELGAGDGSKTVELLKVLQSGDYRFDYLPVDISANALQLLERRMLKELPGLSLKKQQGDYFELLERLQRSDHPKAVLFLGSNIGNMNDKRASAFLHRLADTLNSGDTLLLGVDLIKSRDVVLPAYDDRAGVTRAFNLNLLQRINDDLDADFSLQHFEHVPEYCEQEGVARSYLYSTRDQVVTIASTGQSYAFAEGEKIDTEISRKYNRDIIEQLIDGSGLELRECFTDSEGLFADFVLAKR